MNTIVNRENTISFGDFKSAKKLKLQAQIDGDEYSVKTYRDITRLEKNGQLLLETVPGAEVHDFILDENGASFKLVGAEDTQTTVALFPEAEYTLVCGDTKTVIKTNRYGKAIFNAELESGAKTISLSKIG
jgi:hypothetical protein